MKINTDVKEEPIKKIITDCDNPEDYKYFWGGRFVSLDELPSFARQFFTTLAYRKGGK